MKSDAVFLPAADGCAITAPRRGFGRRSGRLAQLAVAVAVGWTVAVSGFVSGAWAQNSQVQELINHVRRLQQELNTLQRQVYQSAGRKAAQPGAAAAPTAGARKITARLSVKITALEGELRSMTGRYEEFAHSLRQIQQRFDKLVADVDDRLGALERLGAASPGAVGAIAVPPPVPGQAVRSGPSFATGPQILGTIPQNALAKRALAPAAPVRSALPKGTPKQQYDYAHTLIVKDQNFEEAERVLNAFIQAYPKNPLAANAHYWLGRTYFVRQNFKQAAFTFAEGFQKYPGSDKAPANLLNLGMSLAQMKQTKEACTAFTRLLKNFPKATSAVKRRVKRERKRLRCR
jgi:tol-pal system protein YbgF